MEFIAMMEQISDPKQELKDAFDSFDLDKDQKVLSLPFPSITLLFL
jgi:Ca2+-binding EF-hand superfamily protein